MNNYHSWGRYPDVQHKGVLKPRWRNALPDLKAIEGSLLAYGYGRSYGDSCLNEDGYLIDTTGLRQFITFDEQNGILRCEAGVSLDAILKLIVPRGWFLPVTPGTKYVSIGGAIANDVHGKGHHAAGSFGRHVLQFELLRSNGERLICSPAENVDLYKATIGGIGLTGLILWAEIQLKKIPSPFIYQEIIRFENLDEFFEISEDSQGKFPYTVAWIDCLQMGKNQGRGYFTRGKFYDPPLGTDKKLKGGLPLMVPFDMPPFLLNTFTVKTFNEMIYRIHVPKYKESVTGYQPFFYPLDAIHNWYRMYGKPGFLQYQFVLPFEKNHTAIKKVLTGIAQSGQGSFLVVIKSFGDIPSPGMLSFPRPGINLALDFPYRGQKTLRLLDELDEIVMSGNGKQYPAKDARMSPASFEKSYPNWRKFTEFMDPKFSSSFWRRVTEPLSK